MDRCPFLPLLPAAASFSEYQRKKTSTCFVLVQNWDINEKLPAEVEGPFHVALATNVLHTGNNLKSESLASAWHPL